VIPFLARCEQDAFDQPLHRLRDILVGFADLAARDCARFDVGWEERGANIRVRVGDVVDDRHTRHA